MKTRIKKTGRILVVSLLVLQLAGPLVMLFSGKINLDGNWREANRDSTMITPPATQTREAIVQVYSARAFSWRGLFAVHTWIATKKANADQYTVHHVLGWNKRRGLPVVVSLEEVPDRSWYGYTPTILQDVRGERAEALIGKIQAAIDSYPYKNDYTAWPGPNSNTFIAHIGRHVPELGLDLPSTAVGKDYLVNGRIIDTPPSGSGVQFSLFGLFGVLWSNIEGVEINLLGLVTGFDFTRLALKIPGIGELEIPPG